MGVKRKSTASTAADRDNASSPASKRASRSVDTETTASSSAKKPKTGTAASAASAKASKGKAKAVKAKDEDEESLLTDMSGSESPAPEKTVDSNVNGEEALEASGADEDDKKPKKGKKAAKPKAPKEPVKPLDPSLPTNLTIDPNLKPYARTAEGNIRIVSWNVCGVKVAERKGFSTYVDAEDCDILCLQETRVDEPNIESLTKRYPHRYWGVDPKKNYAGVATLSKIEPKNVIYGFPEDGDTQDEARGRIITLEFDNLFLINTYVRNAGNGLKNMDLKIEWNRSFEKHIRALETRSNKKPIIWTGDLNCVPTPKDIRNWKTNYNKSAGCTQTEIDGLMSQMNPDPESGHEKLVDVWRQLHPETEGHYTYYSYKFQCRTKGIGWRLDSFIVTEKLVPQVAQCEIRHDIWGASDHVPIYLDIKGPL